MAKIKWEGILTENLTAFGSHSKCDLSKGQKVIVRKKKVFDFSRNNTWFGEYEYHYSDENDKGLVRDGRFLIEESVK